jgi:hypothetical protein
MFVKRVLMLSLAGFLTMFIFNRTMGLSFDLIEAEALLRMNNVKEATEIGLRRVSENRYSFYPIIASRSYIAFNRTLSPMEREKMESLERIVPEALLNNASRYEEVGQFSESAIRREAAIEYVELFNSDEKISWLYATAALSHALANDTQKSKIRADFARSNMQKLRDAGKPEKNISDVVELLDLYDIISNAKSGKMKEARRSFAARSQWTVPSLGQIMAVNTMLRKEAAPDEIFGSLIKTSDDLWEDRKKQTLATLLEKDKDNSTLFDLILPFVSEKSFESLSGQVWKIDKSRMMSREPNKKNNTWSLYSYGTAMTQADALLLHSALQAKSRGLKNFNFDLDINNPNQAKARFSDNNTGKTVKLLELDTETVIAELQRVIPDPITLKKIKGNREKLQKKK